ncbi:MAG: SixA phosphatase family protein [Verrucomicrobiales bacterium]
MPTRHLALIRHAVAEPEVEGQPDFDRQLVERGRKASREMGAYLKEQEGFRPEVIISSPAPRALETAQLVGAPLGFPPGSIHEDKRIFEASSHDLAEVVRGLPAEWQFVALAGHNPGFSDFAGWLLGQRNFDFPKTAVAWIDCGQQQWSEIEKGAGRLRHFWKPHQLGIG